MITVLKTTSVALTLGLLSFAVPASAAVQIRIKQVGADVIATSVGSIDLRGLSLITSTLYAAAPAVRATDAFISTGAAATVNGWAGLTGPRNIGTGSTVNASSGSGDSFGMNIFPVNTPAGIARIFLPQNYQSGGSINSSAIFLNSTLQTLGLTAGKYDYAIPNDSITVSILAPSVPEPATWAMMVLGFGLIGSAVRRRSGAKTSVRSA